MVWDSKLKIQFVNFDINQQWCNCQENFCVGHCTRCVDCEHKMPTKYLDKTEFFVEIWGKSVDFYLKSFFQLIVLPFLFAKSPKKKKRNKLLFLVINVWVIAEMIWFIYLLHRKLRISNILQKCSFLTKTIIKRWKLMSLV